MTRRKPIQTAQQASFLEALLLGDDSDTASVEPPAAPSQERTAPVPAEAEAQEDTTRDLLGFILGLEPHPAKDFWIQPASNNGRVDQAAALLLTIDTIQSPPAFESIHASTGESGVLPNTTAPNALAALEMQNVDALSSHLSLSITPAQLLEQYPESVARVAEVWNVLREREGLPTLNEYEAQQKLAALLVCALSSVRTSEQIENTLQACLQGMTRLARRLYGSVPQEDSETVQILVDRLMKHSLRVHDEDIEWVRAAFEAGVGKMLTGESQSIYSAIVVSALQRPLRMSVRELLEANELTLPAQVLARTMQNGYRDILREALRVLAQAGLSVQSASVGWRKAHSQANESDVLWKARCSERAAVMLQGRTVINERVTEHPESVLVVTFQCGRAQDHYPVPREEMEQAKRLLWAKGYRAEGEEGYPLPENVTRLWEEYFADREYGWWYGDDAGRVIVVLRYSAARKVRNYSRLRRAAVKMIHWDYTLRYSEDALYFLPAGVALPPEPGTDARDSGDENGDEEMSSPREKRENDNAL